MNDINSMIKTYVSTVSKKKHAAKELTKEKEDLESDGVK